MKKLFLILVMVVFMFVGCTEEAGVVEKETTYSITEITQGYNNNDSIQGVLTNTGGSTMKEIVLIAISEDKALFGTTDKTKLLPGESTEFLITATIGAYDIRETDIEYRVYYDTE